LIRIKGTDQLGYCADVDEDETRTVIELTTAELGDETMAGWSSGRAWIQQVRANRDAGDSVGHTSERGETDGGDAKSRGSLEGRRR
jgi:hypothetical protein